MTPAAAATFLYETAICAGLEAHLQKSDRSDSHYLFIKSMRGSVNIRVSDHPPSNRQPAGTLDIRPHDRYLIESVARSIRSDRIHGLRYRRRSYVLG